ncbi:glycoside hydrolase [Actinospica durhamensis]|uniref:Glycoside hydrolase n=1 Tax=Actinospica durhamensis TaxID=1508375 RepID=A0A941IMP9_9ACTN|nr:glycoside hydrolase family 76 protein [Actinospica durhamensis]MBR7833099.1 glycoside hydrolase [Actinospica durhamensis]
MAQPQAHGAAWQDRAERVQRSLDEYFGTDRPQLFDNWHPLGPGENDTFNYWWLAHALDARIDAYERTGEAGWLKQAVEIHDNLVARNEGLLFNDYFDDMLWFALATLRLAEATGDPVYAEEAEQLWRHVHELGANDEAGGGIAWRKEQLYYKNTPSNGSFVILGARLHRRTGEKRYRDEAEKVLRWLEQALVRPDGFVQDGVNRLGDGAIDTEWKYTYNQGLYIGACVEMAELTGDRTLIDKALRTERAAYAELAEGDVLLDRGDGGDEGLFQGIMHRYAGLLVEACDRLGAHEEAAAVQGRITAATEALWHGALADEERLLAGPDWRVPVPPDGHVPYSAQLSAIMATEVCARLTSRTDALSGH